MSTGKFKTGTIFCRTDILDSNGDKKYWYYKCPDCSYDEYVKNGLCSGIFKSHINNLKKGQLSCRCNNKFPWTSEQRLYQMKKIFNNEYTFIKWATLEGYKNSVSRWVLKCPNPEHNEYECAVYNTLNGKYCPNCAGHNQTQAYINVIKNNDTIIGIKYGIAVNTERRVKQQNNKSTYTIENLSIWNFNNPHECKMAENECKKIVYSGIISKENMLDGYTETTSYENLSIIEEIYKKFNGKQIL